ncbi:hypothetical protein BJ912DRAFT_139481 [Pholiota molesta]|nr:hypothetical protein BJ912DRAFT_139481 [Pholiota molesta]
MRGEIVYCHWLYKRRRERQGKVIFPRAQPSNITESVLDTALVVSLSLLCFLLCVVGILHCLLRRRQRQLGIRQQQRPLSATSWIACPALGPTPPEPQTTGSNVVDTTPSGVVLFDNSRDIKKDRGFLAFITAEDNLVSENSEKTVGSNAMLHIYIA